MNNLAECCDCVAHSFIPLVVKQNSRVPLFQSLKITLRYSNDVQRINRIMLKKLFSRPPLVEYFQLVVGQKKAF